MQTRNDIKNLQELDAAIIAERDRIKQCEAKLKDSWKSAGSSFQNSFFKGEHHREKESHEEFSFRQFGKQMLNEVSQQVATRTGEVLSELIQSLFQKHR